MPFTPFHFGAGAALHSMGPRRISFLAFCAANVFTDTETLYYMIHRQWPAHRFFHTFAGATVVAALTVLCWVLARSLSRRLWLPNVFGWRELGAPAIMAGAFLGTYSHIVLDGMTHADMKPLAPFSDSNPMLGWATYAQVQVLCLGLGLVGIAILFARTFHHGSRTR